MTQLPLFEPETEWTPPTSLPEIPSGVTLAVDTETRDDGLSSDSGAGWATSRGYIAGVSFSWESGANYIPIQHPDTECFDRAQVMAWLQDAMHRSKKTVFFHQDYDQGWLETEGCRVPDDKTDDGYVMAAMIDENRLSYSLESLLLVAWCAGEGRACTS